MTGPARTRLAKLAPLALGIAVLAAGCASNAPQDTLQPEGPQAEKIHNLILPIFGIAGVVFVLILGGALWVSLKFRAKDDDDFNEFPEQVHGNFRLEIGWTILPAVVLAVVAIFTVLTIFDLAKKPADAITVEVTGQQWWWEYRYDLDDDGTFDEIITANDLVIPAGRDISLRIKSNDVIHSWWAPKLNGKKDAVPGRTHPLTIHAPEVGEYIGQCTEFCGLSHAEMRIKVVAVTPEEFDAWTEAQQVPVENPTDDQAIEGWKLFAGSCTSCHAVRGMNDPSAVEGEQSPAESTTPFPYPTEVNQVAGVLPDLTHFMSRSTFAGAKFDLRKDTPECNALGHTWASTEKGLSECLNRADLEAWLRNAPSMKAMYPGTEMSPMSRGMPNFDLTEEQIDQLVAYLITLK
jgi:cytochrome c oxidase subunit II